ncbi:RanGTP-binding protein-domain-containing protein [Lipomyces japonicus]|uniref:RanGTP-binding protein-domain-containing protein n=1 Tax=Lipomyces japonicus TaxID=56871 RepID=UPI0034CD8BFF
MDDLLAKAGNQAVTFAIRSGISLVSGYAFRSLSRFLDKLPEGEKESLEKIKRRLNTKIKIVSPAIDLIQLIAARGNTSLDSTVSLTKGLRKEINEFEEKVGLATELMQAARTNDERKRTANSVEQYMVGLLSRIEEAIPLISLALTTSGANLSASLPDTVSPSRLLQASTFHYVTDTVFSTNQNVRCQVGPDFRLKLYTIFYGTARNPHTTTAGDITWKEEHAKCVVQIFRVPSTGRQIYSYELIITEDLNDGRYHDEFESDSKLEPDLNGVIAGRSRTIPISIVTRLFFSASGRLLEIEDAISPVLVLKLNKAFLNPLFMDQDGDSDEEQGDEAEKTFQGRVDSPSNIEWLAFELYNDDDDDDDEDYVDDGVSGVEEEDDWLEENGNSNQAKGKESAKPQVLSEANLISAFSKLQLSSHEMETLANLRLSSSRRTVTSADKVGMSVIPSPNSLSLLEYIIRIAALQTTDQASVLRISDERITLYLRDENRNSQRENGARDLTDPIGPARSPMRFSDSTAQAATATATAAGTGHLRGSRGSAPATPSSEFKNVVVGRKSGGSGGKPTGNVSHDGNRRRSARISERNSPATPRTSGAQRHDGTPATAAAGGAASVSLTPWERDRLGLDDVVSLQASPLDGKTIRRRRL